MTKKERPEAQEIVVIRCVFLAPAREFSKIPNHY